MSLRTLAETVACREADQRRASARIKERYAEKAATFRCGTPQQTLQILELDRMRSERVRDGKDARGDPAPAALPAEEDASPEALADEAVAPGLGDEEAAADSADAGEAEQLQPDSGDPAGAPEEGNGGPDAPSGETGLPPALAADATSDPQEKPDAQRK
eukprot:TRINITY_DN8473_c0_g1_i1.p1 TRINITY_DN8473_c0_g1~~TRINITY_DN8473_c0_g1_i1.p1  ORF type:complete len:159 (-),score=47.75 TRINITY_DN8473_c0_g1_i1:107-583(-)